MYREKYSGFLTKIALTGIVLVFLIYSDKAFAEQTDLVLTSDQVIADIDLIEAAYQRMHPSYTRYTPKQELANAWVAVRKRAELSGGMSLSEMYLEIQQVLTKIRCEHTKAELPKALIEERKQSPVYLPLRWNVIEQRGLVRIATSGSGLNYGDEILAIDGRPLQELIAEVLPYIPVEGFAEWSRMAGISESLEFRGGAIDHFGALLWGVKPTARLRVQDADGIKRDVMVERIFHDEWLELGKADGVQRNFRDAVTFEREGKDGAYLAIDTFVNYRDTIEPDLVYDPIFDLLKQEKIKYLILDLRNNGGGSHDAQAGLLSRIFLKNKYLNRDARVQTLNLDGLRPYLSTWEKKALKPNRLAFNKNGDGSYSFRKFAGEHRKIKLKNNAFDGKLVLLTSENNSSASTTIAAHLKDSHRAVLVGGKMGGSTEGTTGGFNFTLKLPESGIKLRIPMIRYFTNIISIEPLLGAEPDVYAPMTVNAFRNRQDPALTAAKKLITEF